ncbi:MAG: SNF2-related protein, partial [Verrucomicrobia bacterium]|nr:SNF2-related protein [Verrucomicrobiota bacterium]
MAAFGEQSEFGTLAEGGPSLTEPLRVVVTLDVAGGCLRFDWHRGSGGEPVAQGLLKPGNAGLFLHLFTLELEVKIAGETERDKCGARGTSAWAMLKRVNKRLPVSDEDVQVCVLMDADLGPAKAGIRHTMDLPSGQPAWKWLGREVQQLARLVVGVTEGLGGEAPERGSMAARGLARSWFGFQAEMPAGRGTPGLFPLAAEPMLRLHVTVETIQGFIQCDWKDPQGRQPVATGRVRCTGSDELTWELWVGDHKEVTISTHLLKSIRARFDRWLARFPASRETFRASRVEAQHHSPKPLYVEEPPFRPNESPWDWLAETIQAMAKAVRLKFSPVGKLTSDLDPLMLYEMESDQRRLRRKEQKRAEEERRRQETMARLAEERRRKEQHAAEARKIAQAERATALIKSQLHPSKATAERPALPPVPTHIELPRLEFQETTFALGNLRGYALRERAALWWISNQSDDLLCLPYCHLQRLEYQLRTALRVLGPLRGRALLSDEVGLGKTIEAGLVLKELLTRGMVKRFLVLTVPSLVDQWEEELSDKFGLTTVTTNHAAARGDAQKFWRENPGLVASLHTLKQPAQLEIAKQVHWDILIVDEAHYLRNRESQAW